MLVHPYPTLEKQLQVVNRSDRNSTLTNCCLGWLSFIVEILLTGSLTLILFWVFNYHDGVAWSGFAYKQMNLHYILMIAGFIFMNGHAMLVYRWFTCCKKIYTKMVHTLFFILSSACTAIGMYAAIDARNSGPSSVHFYSMHSWIGLVTCGLFALQFLFGVFTFFMLQSCTDEDTVKFRQTVLPTHITFGLIIFCMASAACLTGLMQVARFNLSGFYGQANYMHFPEEGIVLNSLAMCLVALCIILPCIIRNRSLRRNAIN